MATLSVSRLYKRFGSVEVLKGIDLEARTGEFVALVGPSGCGKSTLLAMIAGLETVSEGEIRIDGRLVNSVAPKDRDIAMVFQSYALYPTMTARQNMTFGMESRRVPKTEMDAAIKRVSALLQIEPLLNRNGGGLACPQLFADALEDQHVGVDAHTNGEDDACDSRQGQGGSRESHEA